VSERRAGCPAHFVRGRRQLALLPVGHQPACHVRGWQANPAYLDAAHRVHARVEDCVRTGKDAGIGKFPSASFAHNQAP
jgi:hypothetical protein